MYAIETKNITKIFKEGKQITKALDGVNLKVRRSQIFGLLGPNGAGKTTLIFILSTLLSQTSGSAAVLGLDVEKDQEEIRKRINICWGGASFYFNLTPYEILNYYAMLYGLENRREKVEDLISVIEISEFRDKKFSKLSTGMKQKLAIAKSLLNDPEVLFLDEPTVGLDVEIAASIRDFIRTLAKEKRTTIILTSHHLTEVEELCKEIAIINKGKITVQGGIEKIKKSMEFPDIIKMRLSDYENLEFLNKLNGVKKYEIYDNCILIQVKPNTTVIENVISAVKRRKRILSIEIEKASLEDVFLKMIRDNHVQKIDRTFL